MPSKKILENQKKTQERIKAKHEEDKHKEVLDQLELNRQTYLQTIQSLAKFLAGHTTKTTVTNQLKSINTPDVDKVVKSLGKLNEDLNKRGIDWTPLLEALKPLEEHLASIPKEMPEAPEKTVVDFTETNKLITAVESAIKGLDLVVKPADIHVPKQPTPNVNVNVDLEELKKPLLELLNEFKSFEIPESPETDVTSIEKKLDIANKHLKKLVDKPIGGGGGGGGMVPFRDPSTLNSVQVTLDADGNVPVSITGTLVPGVDFDLLTITNTDTNKDTLVYTLGVTTVSTLVITYASGAEKISDSFSTLEYV